MSGEYAALTFRASHVPQELTRPYELSFGSVPAFEAHYVYLVDAAGAVRGIGEITPLPGYGSETPAIVRQEVAGFAGHVARGGAPQEWIRSCHLRSPFVSSALECMFETLRMGLDRTLHAPLEREVPLCAICQGHSPEELAANAGALVRAGYRTLKVKLGKGDATADAARIAAVHQAAGGRAGIRMDANQAYGFDAAVRLAEAVGGMGVDHFEQPFGVDAWSEHAALARVSPVPVMLDESIGSPEDVRRAADIGVGLVKFKLCKALGMAGLEDSVATARSLGLGVILGNGVQTGLGNRLEHYVHAACGLETASEAIGFLKPRTPYPGQHTEIRAGMLRHGGLAPLAAADLDGGLFAEARLAWGQKLEGEENGA